jgi:hypothetical protein
MTNEEKIRKRFREFSASFTCGVINPANMKERCSFARHEGAHSWHTEEAHPFPRRTQQSDEEFEAIDLPKVEDTRERFGTWARFNGAWYVRSSGTYRRHRQTGDIVRIQAKDGSLKTVRLGDRVAPGVFDWFGGGEDEGEQEGALDQAIPRSTI